MRVKKIISLLCSLLLCVTMFTGCSHRSTQNNQNEIDLAFYDALNNYYKVYLHGTINVEASNSSVFTAGVKNKYGNGLKSIKNEYKDISEIKKDKYGNVESMKTLKSVDITTYSCVDGKNVTTTLYITGDGNQYVSENGKEIQSEYISEWVSVDYNLSSNMSFKNIQKTTEGSRTVFSFDVEKQVIIANALVLESVRADADMVLEIYNGSLAIDDVSGVSILTINIEFKDKNTAETLKANITIETSDTITGLEFPSDLASYTNTGK